MSERDDIFVRDNLGYGGTGVIPGKSTLEKGTGLLITDPIRVESREPGEGVRQVSCFG